MKTIEECLNKLKGRNFNEELEDKSTGYRLKETIGQGNFGKVRKALHIDTSIEVAVKMLDKVKMIEFDDTQRVKREIQILGAMDHPHIAYLYEILDQDTLYFFILEHCTGGDLASYVASKRVKDEFRDAEMARKYQKMQGLVDIGLVSPRRANKWLEKPHLDEFEACRFFCQLLSALRYMHGLGVVHRDIKPENLLLDSENNLKMIDFGLGNLYSERQKLSTPCGSPCYAPPEMITGVDYDPEKSDIWSSGVTLYIMLCGVMPFKDENIDSLYQRILKTEPFFPPFLSKEAKAFLEALLAKDPEKRIGFDQALEHEWVRIHQPDEYDELVGSCERRDSVRPIDLDEIKSKILENYEIEKTELDRQIQSGFKNCITAQ